MKLQNFDEFINESKLMKFKVGDIVENEIHENTDPSLVYLDDVLAEFKKSTGITPGKQIIAKPGRQGDFFYVYDLTSSIKSPIEKALFKVISLQVSTYKHQNDEGNSFTFDLMYTHHNGGSNGKSIGSIFVVGDKIQKYRAF